MENAAKKKAMPELNENQRAFLEWITWIETTTNSQFLPTDLSQYGRDLAERGHVDVRWSRMSPAEQDRTQIATPLFRYIARTEPKLSSLFPRGVDPISGGVIQSILHSDGGNRRYLEARKLSKILLPLIKEHGDQWWLHVPLTTTHNAAFKSFLKGAATLFSEIIEDTCAQSTDATFTEDRNNALRVLKDLGAIHRDAIFPEINHSKARKKQTDTYEASPADNQEVYLTSAKKPVDENNITAAPYANGKKSNETPDIISHALQEQVNMIAGRIENVPGQKKFAQHKQNWAASGLAASVATLLAECKPSAHQPVIEVLNQPALWDMLLQSCAPEHPEAAISHSTLTLPKGTFSGASFKIRDSVNQAVKAERAVNKRSTLSAERLEIIARFEDASNQDNVSPELWEALAIIHDAIRGMSRPPQQLQL